MPKPDAPLSAVVVVGGGKQYRVAPGDQILVDRLAAEPGSSLKLGRVLLVNDGGQVKVGTPGVEGVEVEAKVLAHRRGPRLESLRYKSKKRVRVHHGGRADLTAISIISIGGVTARPAEAGKAEDVKTKDVKARDAKAQKTEAREPKAEVKTATRRAAAPKPAKAAAAEPQAPAKRAPRRSKKESDGT